MSDIRKNIASHLPVASEESPDLLAVAVQGKMKNGKHTYSELTFRELNEQSDAVAHGLLEMGITRGMRTVLMVPPGMDFFALTFGVFKAGAVPVVVDPGMGIRNLRTCLNEAEPEAFIGIPKAHIARMLLGWGKPTVHKLVTAGTRLFWGGRTLKQITAGNQKPFEIQDIQPNETAAILFTSGSTGVPKGVIYTHEMFNTQVSILKNDYKIEHGERDVATFPLFALFGPALGMAAVIPDMDASKPGAADPANIIAAARDYSATNMFCSPALIEKVGRYGYDRRDTQTPVRLESIRRVISAGAPAKPDSLERFSVMLNKGIDILNSYGATESLPVSFIGSSVMLDETAVQTKEGKGVCVGSPVREAEVKIIRITDDPVAEWNDGLPLPDGEIGEIAVRGPMVSPSYFRREESTVSAKIPCRDGTFFHRMGDAGYFDPQGRLWMCGRKTHRVVLKDRTLFTIPCERIFDAHAEVNRTALVGITLNGKVEPVLCIELKQGHDAMRDQIRKELEIIAEDHDQTKDIKTFLFHPSFPVDVRHNAKIFREQLTEWAQKELTGKS